jgi:hypothetical protein
MALLSDEKSNGPQFSKLVIIFCLLTMVLGILGAVAAYILFGVSESIICSLIAAAGGCGMTAVVWYLKKSQAENTMKMYLSAYKDIASFKVANGEDAEETLNQVEDNLLYKMGYAIDANLDEATSPIENQNM